MQVVPNPDKEAANLRNHGLDFSRAAELLAQPYLDEPDDRPLGYEQEGGCGSPGGSWLAAPLQGNRRWSGDAQAARFGPAAR